MKRAYFVVEGPHDIEFVGRLLSWWKLKRVRNEKQLDEFWAPLVPRVFPPQGDLLARVPVPTFFANDESQVAVNSAIGDSNLAKMFSADLGNPNFDAKRLDAVALVLDADTKSPEQRWSDLRTELAVPREFDLDVPTEPNQVSTSRIRCGAFVLPGDGRTGTLETLLLETGEYAYPTLLADAKTYLDQVHKRGRDDTESNELKDFDKPSGRDKARIAVVVAALKPGKATQVSIQDNRWLTEKASAVPGLARCLQFIASILGTPTAVHP